MPSEWKTDKEKAEALNNSRPFDVHRWSDFQEVNDAVDRLHEMLNGLEDFKGKKAATKRNVKTVVLDLYVAWLVDPTKYISYPRSKSSYKQGRYNELHISFASVPIIDALEELGFVENWLGFFSEHGRSRLSRMRATTKLINLVKDDFKVTLDMVSYHEDRECIILREKDEDGRKIDIDYNDTNYTIHARVGLKKYNEILKETSILCEGYPESGTVCSGGSEVPIDPTDKFVRRIFNNKSWAQGGRFFGGWWQRIPKEWRKRITINGEPVREPDYSGHHITMLYTLEGIDYWTEIDRDPYKLEGVEHSPRMRGLLKELLLIALNANTKQTAIKALNKKITDNVAAWRDTGPSSGRDFRWVRQEGVDLNNLYDALLNKHKPIAHNIGTGVGLKLQNYDAEIAEVILSTCTEQGIPILCIHDGFVVPEYAWEFIEKLMELAYTQIMGNLSKGKIKPTAKVSGTRLEYNAEQISKDISEMLDSVAQSLGFTNGSKLSKGEIVDPKKLKAFQEAVDARLQSGGNSSVDIKRIVKLPSESADGEEY